MFRSLFFLWLVCTLFPMKGFAQTLFLEKEKRSLGEVVSGHLNALVDRKLLPAVDLLLAEHLLRPFSEATENTTAFLCYLSMAARKGHLCVSLEEGRLNPDPAFIWGQFCENELEPSTADAFVQMVLKGLNELPSALLTEITSPKQRVFTPICRWHHYLYLQRNWVQESFFLEQVQRIESAKPAISLDATAVHQQVRALEEQQLLLPEQSEAIIHALNQTIALISGGPGTGKTYTAGMLIKVLWDSLTDEQKQTYEIALAAPTGKAAANLQASLNKALGSYKVKALKAMTLHSLLGVHPAQSKQLERSKTLFADLVVVDESSMIDLHLMGQLFASLKKGARIILLGDPDQLPAVESGSLFADLLDAFKKKNTPVTQLKTCMRAELRGIIHLAEAIKQGDSNLTLQLLTEGKEGIRHLLPSTKHASTLQTQEHLVAEAVRHFPQFNDSEEDPQILLKTLRTFCLLTPLRKGPYGVDVLNQLILKKIMKKQQHHRMAIPIILNRGSKQLELHNGDIGFLLHHPQRQESQLVLQEEDYVLLPGKEGLRKLPAFLAPSFDYAYCLSVHKSQGSEYDHVLLLLPPGSAYFGREMLYTAATRARKWLDIWSEDAVLRETIACQTRRMSGIVERYNKLPSQISGKILPSSCK